MKQNNRLITKDTEFIHETRACGLYGFSAGMSNRYKLRALVAHEVVFFLNKLCRRYRVADVLEARRAAFARLWAK